MDVNDYRRRYETELAETRRARHAAVAPTPRHADELAAAISDRALPPADRTAAVSEATDTAVTEPGLMTALIRVLADESEDATVRLAVLEAIEEISFRANQFEPYAPDFLAAVRAAVTDPDRELRDAAMDALALRNDEYVQRLLIDGLRDPKRALVKPQRALQLIGYDVHAEHHSVLREIVESSKSSTLRREALRLLSADSDSTELFERIATDRQEDDQARMTSAIALQSLDPARFEGIARAIVSDDDDADNVRATFLTALAHQREVPADRDFDARVREVQQSTQSKQLDRAARQFIRLSQTDS